MTKLASENATNKANAQGFSLKEGRAAVDGQVAADPSAKAAVAVPVKAALNGKAGAGVAAPVPAKANPHADAVKKDERDEDAKHNNKASDDAEGQVEHLAMVDASASAAVGTLSPEAGQDAGGAPAADSSSDDDGGDSTPLIIGGVVLLGGGIALAAGGGGGGDKAPANTPPVVSAQTNKGNEDTTISGKLTATDANNDTLTYAVTGTAPAGVTLNADGSYSLDAKNAAYQSLAAGATKDVVVNFTVSDGKGGSTPSTLTITVTGVNDAPTTTAQTATATEDAAAVTGKLTAADVDTGDTQTYSLNAPVAGLTLNADGSYSFDAGNAAYQSLAKDEVKDVVANFTVTDKTGATATSTLTIKVTGVNDAPVAVADTATATEDGAVVTGNVGTNDSDVDTGATLTYAISGTAPAGLTLNTNGSYSFDPASYDSIGAGVTQNVVANYTVSDGKGGTATSTLTITVTGVNDAPVGVAATAAAIEDGAVVTGQLAATDVDVGDTLTYTLNAPVTGLTLNANGSFSFDPASYDSLAAGATQNVVANYTVSDGKGGTATSTLTITVTGVNDAPVAGDDAFTVAEDTALSGTVGGNDTDVDVGDTRTYALVGTVPAGLVFNTDGTFSFNADDPSYDSIAAGATRVVSFDYKVTDKHGGFDTATANITVTGVNDAPVITSSDAATVAENQPTSTVIYTTVFTDPDADDTFTYSLQGADKDAFNISNTGVVTLKTSADYETKDVYNFTVVVSDNHGGQDTQAVVLTVTDAIDALSLDAASDADILTLEIVNADGVAGVKDINYGFTESLGIDNFVRVDNFGANDFIQFDTNPTGYAFSSNGNGDLIIENTNGGKFSSITLAGAVATNAFVTDYASAEAALDAKLGAGDYLRGVVPPANVSLDTYPGNDGDPLTFETLDAGGAATIFTDLGAQENSVIINNFSSDDRIIGTKTLTGDPTYSFAADSNDPRDLIIQYSSGNNLSYIILNDVLPQNAGFISNEASAEQAVGFDFFSYA